MQRHDGGREPRVLDRLRHDYPLSLHGVGLALGSAGPLDRTHLRFFTRSSLVRLFTEAGFDTVRMQGINPTGSLKFKLANLVTLGRWADMRWLQFACVARPRRLG